MIIELTTEQKDAVRHALEVYLSGLREETVNTEKYEWKEHLHREKDILAAMIKKLSWNY
jgi:hypothetical protein